MKDLRFINNPFVTPANWTVPLKKERGITDRNVALSFFQDSFNKFLFVKVNIDNKNNKI